LWLFQVIVDCLNYVVWRKRVKEKIRSDKIVDKIEKNFPNEIEKLGERRLE
jgi:hypothetical protein